MIVCNTLGAPRITIDGAPPPPELLWRKNTALLVYLARSPERTRTREHLCGMLWPDKPESSSRHSLNEALRSLRHVSQDEVVETDARAVRLSQRAVELDVDRFSVALEAEEWETAAELAVGPFMEGFGVPDCSAFEDWLSLERRHWQARAVQALVCCSEQRLDRGDLIGAEHVIRRAHQLDPLSDTAIQVLIRAVALRGDRGEALSLFAGFQAALAEHLGAEPAPETVRLADRVRRERTWRLPEAVAMRIQPPERAELVGRSGELERALQLWRGSRRESRAGLLVVDGESGIGKTRLLEEVAGRARLDGAVVSGIRAVPADRDLPGSSLLALCRGGLDAAPGLLEAPPEAHAAIAESVPAWSERFADLCTAPACPLPHAFSALLRAACSEQPLVLSVDDAEYLDLDTLAALELVLRDLEDLPLLVALALEGPGGRDVADRLQAGVAEGLPCVRISLERWSEEAMQELVKRVLPEYEQEARDRLARRVAADSGGLPLLATELVFAIQEGLELDETGEHAVWPSPSRTLEETLPSDLPDSLRAAVRVSFRTLSESGQVVGGAASVLESRFLASDVAAVCERDLPLVEQALDELEWRRWVYAEPRGYVFAARVVREIVVQDMLAPGQRQRFRERAGLLGPEGVFQ